MDQEGKRTNSEGCSEVIENEDFRFDNSPTKDILNLLESPKKLPRRSCPYQSLSLIPVKVDEEKRKSEFTALVSRQKERLERDIYRNHPSERDFREQINDPEDKLGFCFGKPGWICSICSNFNFESTVLKRQEKMQ